MLPKGSRLRANADFSRVYKLGRRQESPNLRLFYLPRGGKQTRAGFVVSKKSTKVGAAAGKIADRNRVKRVLREEARLLLPKLPPGFDIVVQAREGVVKIPAEEIRAELRKIFQKSGLVKISN